MEKIPYEEARQWFWTRTGIWFLPAFILTAIACFFYNGDLLEVFKDRLTVSLLMAFAATLFGLINAAISMQFPWMRLGRWQYWWLNAIICGVTSGLCAAGLSAIVLTVMRGNVDHYPSGQMLETANDIMIFGICIAAAWGAIFGTWFALRFDKYFVESI